MSGHFIQGNICLSTHAYAKSSVDYLRIDVAEDKPETEWNKFTKISV